MLSGRAKWRRHRSPLDRRARRRIDHGLRDPRFAPGSPREVRLARASPPVPVVRRQRPRARKKVPVIFDGGVRRGADVLKALALGADLVAFGRPLVWGLACGGEEGVDRVIQTLDEELRTAMALCGVNRLDKASLADLARRRGNPPPGRRPRGAYSRL